MRWKPLLVALVVSASACIAHAADAPRTLRLSLVAEIEVAADGRIARLDWTTMPGPLQLVAERIEPQVRGWRFEPGAIDGVPQVTRTHLTVGVVGVERDDGGAALSIERASTGAGSVALAPPRYPVNAALAGIDADAVADVRIDEHGRASIQALKLKVPRTYRQEFIAAIHAAVAASTFKPEQVGGRPLAAVIRIPYEFCSSDGCNRRIDEAAARPAAGAPARPREPVALDSAVRLLDEVAGQAI